MTPTPEQLAEAVDLTAIKAKIDGGAWITCCRHPDIDRSGCGPASKQRQCVLDDGNPEACEMSDPGNRNPVTDKTACEFWQPLQAQRPQRLSIAEARALLAALQAKDAALRPFSYAWTSQIAWEDMGRSVHMNRLRSKVGVDDFRTAATALGDQT